MSKTSLKTTVSFSATAWAVAKAAGNLAKQDASKDELIAAAIKAYKACPKKEIEQVDVAFKAGYMAFRLFKSVTLSNVGKANARLKSKDADEKAEAKAAQSASTSALHRLKKAMGFKVVAKKGGNRGTGNGKPKSAKAIAAEKAQEKAIQTAAKALAEKAGVLPPAVVNLASSAKYNTNVLSSLMNWNDKQKVAKEIADAVKACHAIVAKVNAATK